VWTAAYSSAHRQSLSPAIYRSLKRDNVRVGDPRHRRVPMSGIYGDFGRD